MNDLKIQTCQAFSDNKRLQNRKQAASKLFLTCFSSKSSKYTTHVEILNVFFFNSEHILL